MSEDETVHVKKRRRGGPLDVYHTDPECYNFANAVATRPITRAEAAQRGLRCCDQCAGEAGPPGGDANDPYKYIRQLGAVGQVRGDE